MSAPQSLPPAFAALLVARFGAHLPSAEQLAGGRCNMTWKLSTDLGPIAARLGAASGLRLGADRRSEVAALEAAFPIAPAVLLADVEAGWLVTEWIPGRHWTRDEVRQPGHLQRVAALLARLHALPIPIGVRRLGMRSTLVGLGAPPGPETEAWLAALEGGAVIGLCHHDPHHQNIVVGVAAELRLVDWEYAAVGECVNDLAEYANAHELDARESALLLAGYRKAGGRANPLQLEAARSLCRLRNALWEAEAAKKQS